MSGDRAGMGGTVLSASLLGVGGLGHPGRDFWTVLQGLRSKGQERAAPGCREQCGSRVLKPEAAVVCLGA